MKIIFKNRFITYVKIKNKPVTKNNQHILKIGVILSKKNEIIKIVYICKTF